MDLLARREHSRAELGAKLRARGADPSTLETVLDALAAERLQSDARYAEQYLRQRAEKGYGPLRIAQELRQRGVAESQVDEALARQEFDWTEQASAVRAKRFGRMPPRDIRERAKQVRFLEYRGFAADQIRQVLKHNHDLAD
jgi:regulatory protein